MVAVLPSPEDQVEAQKYLVASIAENLDRVGKGHGLVQDSLGPCLVYLDIAKLVASEDCFLIGEAVVAAGVVIVECEEIAEKHEGHIRRNVAGIAGVEKEATFGSVVRIHTYFLDQDHEGLVEDLAISPFDPAAWSLEVLLSLEFEL